MFLFQSESIGQISPYITIALPVVDGSLCDLCKELLFVGKFPEYWKIKHITSISKSGAKDGRSSNRPKSVLAFIPRLFEKLIFNQFYDCLNGHKSLYEHQPDFPLLHSVDTALMATTNHWYMNIEKMRYTMLT